jgi:hypothetical protein
MDVSKIPSGRNPPLEINVLIEIPQGGVPVKYELDKISGPFSSIASSTPRRKRNLRYGRRKGLRSKGVRYRFAVTR